MKFGGSFQWHVFILTSLSTWPTVALAAEAPAADFYVAPTGDDAGPGSLDEPFATLSRAQGAVRDLVALKPGRDITVLVRGGGYVLAEPLDFTPADGAASHRVIYAAYPSETPVLTGGRTVHGWTRVDGDHWSAPVPESIPTLRDFYCDDRRLTRARFPDEGAYLHVASVSGDVTQITLDTAPPGADLAGAELVVIQNWSITRVPIARSEGALVVTSVPAGWIGHGDATTTSAGKPAYLENASTFLNRPDEWYYDARARKVHYWAPPGDDPNTHTFTAPGLDQLLRIRGTKSEPVQNLSVQGLAFEHAAWTLPDFGYIGIQAGHHGTRTDAPTYALPAAIDLRYARGCRFEACRIAHTGASGIALGAGCRENTIMASTWVDIGGNAIMVGRRELDDIRAQSMNEDSYLAADWLDADDAPRGNTIAHNAVTRAGAVQFGAVGIFDAFSNGTHIHHNHVYDLPYTGISLGFRWDTSPTTQSNALVEFNHIHDVMKTLADGGGIYTLGVQPGCVLRGNLIHDVHRSAIAHGGAPNNGIFFDQGSSAIHVEGMMIYATSGDPIRFNQTDRDQLTWGDNIFSDAAKDTPAARRVAEESGP